VDVQKSVVELVSSRQVADQALALPARAIGAPQVICVPASQTLGEVAETMRNKGVVRYWSHARVVEGTAVIDPCVAVLLKACPTRHPAN
jgi:hypothetical protein